MFVVDDPSFSLSVVWCGACFVFPATILYIAFKGLVDDVRLQNSFQDLLFSPLMAEV